MSKRELRDVIWIKHIQSPSYRTTKYLRKYLVFLILAVEVYVPVAHCNCRDLHQRLHSTNNHKNFIDREKQFSNMDQTVDPCCFSSSTSPSSYKLLNASSTDRDTPLDERLQIDAGNNCISECSTSTINSCTKHQDSHSLMTKNGDHGRIKSLLLKEAKYDVDDSSNTKRRSDYLSWDDYFMSISALSALRSKDPESQMGACIVDSENRIVGIGYNGFPRGCSDDHLPWTPASFKGIQNMTDDMLRTKEAFVVHAEVNAILNKCSADVKGARIYVPDFPCNECAKVIIQSGIKEVIYMNKIDNNTSSKASSIMFQMADVTCRQYSPNTYIEPLDFSKFGPPTVQSSDAKCEENESIFRDLVIKEGGFDPCQSDIVRKRKDYVSWDDYFTSVAFLSARRSKDPNTQVGACIVDSNKSIVGIGYNGFPRGCSDEYLPWARNACDELHKKYPYVVHAEVNAILNKGSKDVKNATLYVALFPCNECAKVIIQAGIAEVVYLNDMYHDTASTRASRIMFDMSGVKYRQYIPSKTVIRISFSKE